MTRALRPHTIYYVSAPTDSRSRAQRPEIALTKRRAVDFCRVATAICPATPGIAS
jgi:hypothetical protein